MKSFVCYYRVSTQRQGRSGLGLESQKTICNNYIISINEATKIQEFIEIESGKTNNRKGLNDALKCCKDNNATLLVAKLDRLSREVEFIFHLRNSKVDFVCADIPELTTLTLGIFASFAQHERELISQRTKKALEEKKKQGVKLGNPQLLYDKDNIQFNKSLKVRKENAYNNENNKRAGAFIVNLRNSKTKWKNIVIQLNDNGFRTRRGGRFSMTQARLLYERYIS